MDREALHCGFCYARHVFLDSFIQYRGDAKRKFKSRNVDVDVGIVGQRLGGVRCGAMVFKPGGESYSETWLRRCE